MLIYFPPLLTFLQTFFCDFQILNFDVRKKRTKLPELGSGGGGFRWFGQCPKENVFFSVDVFPKVDRGDMADKVIPGYSDLYWPQRQASELGFLAIIKIIQLQSVPNLSAHYSNAHLHPPEFTRAGQWVISYINIFNPFTLILLTTKDKLRNFTCYYREAAFCKKKKTLAEMGLPLPPPLTESLISFWT